MLTTIFQENMRTSLIYILLLAITAAMPLHAQDTKHIISVGNFTELSVFDNINVTYRCNTDSAGKAVISGSQDLIDQIILQNNQKGKLTVQVSTQLTLTHSQLPTLYVYSDSLLSASNAGDSTLRLDNVAKVDQLKIVLSDNGKIIAHGLNAPQLLLSIRTGHGKIIADGTCSNLSVHNLGTGEIQADNVTATDVHCRVVGTGTVGCFVNGGFLRVKGAGSGKVYYKGKPSNVKVTKIGSLKAIAM